MIKKLLMAISFLGAGIAAYELKSTGEGCKECIDQGN